MKAKTISGWVVIAVMVFILAVSFSAGYAAGSAHGYSRGFESAQAEYAQIIDSTIGEIRVLLVETKLVTERAQRLITDTAERLEEIY